MSPIGIPAHVTTEIGLSDPTLSATALIGLSNQDHPVFLDVREESNTAQDFCTFISLALAAGFFEAGDFLVYDNAKVHFASNTREELEGLLNEANVNFVALPTYSPELNPIERCFGLVKHFIRYKRRPGQSLLDGFALVTFEMIAKEYFETLKIASEPIEQPDANQ